MSAATHSAISNGEVKVSPRPKNASTIEGAEMPRPWLSSRAQQPLPRSPEIILSRPSTTLIMAVKLTTTMLNTITKLFAPKVPTTKIAGVALTHDEAAQLMHTCTALKNALSIQLDDIGQMPSRRPERAVSTMSKIQTRHVDIHIHLTLIVSKTKFSNIPWVREFGDAHAALLRKIVAINRRR